MSLELSSAIFEVRDYDAQTVTDRIQLELPSSSVRLGSCQDGLVAVEVVTHPCDLAQTLREMLGGLIVDGRVSVVDGVHHYAETVKEAHEL